MARRDFLRLCSAAAAGAMLPPRAFAEPQPMRDIVVLVPGITGSVLRKDGKDLWALSGQAFFSALRSMGRNLDALRLGADDAFRLFTAEMGSWWPLDTHGRAEEFDGAKTERLVFEEREDRLGARLVTPGRIRVRTALRYSRMNWMSSRCHGAYFPLTGQTRPISLV